MPTTISTYNLPLLMASFALLSILVQAIRRRGARGAYDLIGSTAATLLYVFGYAMELGAHDLESVQFWLKIEYLGATTAPVFMYRLVTAYLPQHRVIYRLRWLLFAIPVVTLGLAWTSGWHGLIWQNMRLIPFNGINLLEFDTGGWYYVQFLHTAMVIALGLIMVGGSLGQLDGLYRRQMQVFLFAVLAPAITMVIYGLRLLDTPIDIIPYGLSLTAFFMAWNVLSNHFGDLVPVARGVVVASIPDPVIVFDLKGRVVDVNEAARRVLGLIPSPVLTPVGLPATIRDLLDATQDCTHEIVITGPYGQPIYFDARMSMVRDQRKALEGRLLVLHDITQRKHMEVALRESQFLLESFFSQSLDGFFFMMIDRPVQWDDSVDKEAALDYVFEHQRVSRVNTAMADQYGASSAQLLGLTPAQLYADNLAKGRATLRRLFDRGSLHIQDEIPRLDNGQPVSIEGHYVCMHDHNGHIIGHFGIQRDVTERLRTAELALDKERLEFAFKKEQELSALKSLMMIRIAHEFRTPLAIIGTSGFLLERHHERMDQTQRAEHFGKIHRQIDHLRDLLDDVALGMDRAQGRSFYSPSELAAGETVREIINRVRERHATTRTITLQDDTGGQTVFADRSLLERIVSHLLSNALKYSSPETEVTISAALYDRVLTLSVIDHGIGVLPEERGRIFEPFFRGSNFDELPGLGLGLTKVREAVEACGGEIDVLPTPGGGATFTARIPVHARAAVAVIP
jgi:PAS domain S-box-containing protein